jgi:hypothetical protein
MRRSGMAAGMAALMLLVALVVGMLAASSASASASGPVWAYCAKAAPKNTGAYSDKSCTTAAAGHTGKYELPDGIGNGKPFKGRSEGFSIHGVVPPGEFNTFCEQHNHETVSGRFVAPNKVADVVISGSDCRTNISEPAKTCTFDTAPLSGELGWIDQAKGEAGLKLTSEAEPEIGLIAETSGCVAEVKERWRGSAIGTWGQVGGISKESTLTYVPQQFLGEPPRYDQDSNPLAFEGEAGIHILRSEVNDPENGFEWSTAHGNAAALGASFHDKGEALMVH